MLLYSVNIFVQVCHLTWCQQFDRSMYRLRSRLQQLHVIHYIDTKHRKAYCRSQASRSEIWSRQPTWHANLWEENIQSCSSSDDISSQVRCRSTTPWRHTNDVTSSSSKHTHELFRRLCNTTCHWSVSCPRGNDVTRRRVLGQQNASILMYVCGWSPDEAIAKAVSKIEVCVWEFVDFETNVLFNDTGFDLIDVNNKTSTIHGTIRDTYAYITYAYACSDMSTYFRFPRIGRVYSFVTSWRLQCVNEWSTGVANTSNGICRIVNVFDNFTGPNLYRLFCGEKTSHFSVTEHQSTFYSWSSNQTINLERTLDKIESYIVLLDFCL